VIGASDADRLANWRLRRRWERLGRDGTVLEEPSLDD
jgi:hypothetical protein